MTERWDYRDTRQSLLSVSSPGMSAYGQQERSPLRPSSGRKADANVASLEPPIGRDRQNERSAIPGRRVHQTARESTEEMGWQTSR